MCLSIENILIIKVENGDRVLNWSFSPTVVWCINDHKRIYDRMTLQNKYTEILRNFHFFHSEGIYPKMSL